MKILFMSPEAILGGGERSLLDLLWSFRNERPDVEVGLLLGGDGPLAEEAEQLGVEVFRVRLPQEFAGIGENAFRLKPSREALAKALTGSASLAAHVAQVNRTIREFRPTHVHTNGVKSHVLAALAAPPRLPLVWHVRDFLSERRLGSKLLRSLAWRPRLAVANSEAVAQDTRTLFPKLRVRVVTNAIDLEKLTPDGPKADLDALAGVERAPALLKVGLVATYARWKGQDTLIDAAKLVSKSLPRAARFFIVGGPVYRTAGSQLTEGELRARANELGIADDIAFVPFQTNPADVFRALDVVVHASSRPEPFGRTIVEGMACGRAVIAVDAGGASEIIRHESNGLAIPPANPEALAEAILRLASDAELRAHLGAEARRDAVARFSRERLAADMLKAYEAMSD